MNHILERIGIIQNTASNIYAECRNDTKTNGFGIKKQSDDTQDVKFCHEHDRGTKIHARIKRLRHLRLELQELLECVDSFIFDEQDHLLSCDRTIVSAHSPMASLIGSPLDNKSAIKEADRSSLDNKFATDGTIAKTVDMRTVTHVGKILGGTAPRADHIHKHITNIEVREIKITEALKLPARVVGSFDLVQPDGELYYVNNTGHFAIKICGFLFHGSIGNIYTDANKKPTKIKNCKFDGDCAKGSERCDYFHDPVKFLGSTDVRNFIASSWLYAPANSDKSRTGSRRFGSYENLDRDIMLLHDEETDRFCDQTMHDILCAMLLKKYYVRRG